FNQAVIIEESDRPETGIGKNEVQGLVAPPRETSVFGIAQQGKAPRATRIIGQEMSHGETRFGIRRIVNQE
ncbi:MAG: hypothetical protein KBE53_11580, partial [Chromatiaceae bacterium]|nr:hypothetical protein [Chromatiaceae bacterium]